VKFLYLAEVSFFYWVAENMSFLLQPNRRYPLSFFVESLGCLGPTVSRSGVQVARPSRDAQ
jgi:hypothetical protein